MEGIPLTPNQENPDEKLKQEFEHYISIFSLTEEELQKPLLDVGAGTGKFVAYVRDVLHNKKAFGVDSRKLKPHLAREGMVVGDGMSLPEEKLLQISLLLKESREK